MSEEHSSGYTSVSQFGEFRLISHLTRNFSLEGDFIVKSIGDDAAVVRPENGYDEVFSTDLLIEGIHFDLSYVPLRHLGYKSVIVNLSDIVAMNAIPYGITVSIAASNRFPIEALDELYSGIQLACEKYGVKLLGGDTSSSRQGLIISVTAFGRVKENEAVFRSGAKPTDLVCVSGDVGSAYAGFLVLDREKAVFLKTPDLQPDLTNYDYVVGRQLKPEARIDICQTLRDRNVMPTSMIDISDGIASELHHICQQSKCGAKIFSGKLPIDYQTVSVAEEFEISPTTFAMNGGEDYQLLFTVSLKDFDKIKDIREISIIGHITEDPEILQIVLDSGEIADIEAQGWNHFPNESQ